MIEFMLRHDLRTDQTDTEGCSLLHYAVINSTCTGDIIQLLITNGADINLQNNYSESVLERFLNYNEYECSLVRLFLDNDLHL